MSTAELGQSAKKSLLWYTTLPFAVHILRFAGSIVLARILAPEDFGVISIVSILFFYSNTFTDFGLSNAIVQRKSIELEHYGTVFAFNLFVSCVLFILFQLIAGDVAKYYEVAVLEPVLRVFSCVFIISSFMTVPIAYLRRQVQFKAIAIIEAIRVIFSVVVILWLAYAGYGVWSMVFGMLSSQILGVILLLIVSERKLVLSCSVNALKDLFNFSMWSFLNLQLVLISENIEKLILGKVLNVQLLGYFDKGAAMAKMPYDQIGAKVSSISFSTFSRIKDDKQQLSYYFERIYTVVALICFPVYFGLHAISEEFTLVLLGEKWAAMIPVLSLMSIAFLLYSMCSLYASFNMAVGYIKTMVTGRAIITVGFIIALVMIAEQGIEAVALTIIAYNVILLIFAAWLANKSVRISITRVVKLNLPPIVSTAFMYSAIAGFIYLTPNMQQGLHLLFGILLGILVYAICVLWLPFKYWGFVRQEVKSKLPKQLSSIIAK